MKHQWVAYAIVAFLSVGAGVAIAGLPDDQPVDPTIIPPTTTERPTPTLAPTTVPPATDPPATTSPPATEAGADTTATTLVPATTVPPTTIGDGLPARAELAVAVANGADVEGLATGTAGDLETLGYVDVAALDGTLVADFTVVYFTPTLEDAAIRLAEDLGANPDLRAPLSEAPPVDGLNNVQLLAYLGADRPAP